MELTLQAQPRTILGKKVKQLRRQGLVPGSVYGPVVTETVSVCVERREFDRFYMVNGHSTLFTLVWEGGRQAVFIRDVQIDPVKRTAIHVNFFAPNLRQELTAMVSVVMGHPNPNAEGVLTTQRTEVEVRGLPAALPHQIDVDISGLLAVHDALRAGDLVLPEGIVLVTDPEEMLAHLAPSSVEAEDEVAGEAAEAAEAPTDAVPATEGDTTSE